MFGPCVCHQPTTTKITATGELKFYKNPMLKSMILKGAKVGCRRFGIQVWGALNLGASSDRHPQLNTTTVPRASSPQTGMTQTYELLFTCLRNSIKRQKKLSPEMPKEGA
jgi:hypothetical protein